jgi:hypothetical protein
MFKILNKTNREEDMRQITLNQSKDGKNLQPNLKLRLQILIQRHSPVSVKSFGFERYYASQSPSPADRKNLIQRPSTQRRLSSCSQIHYGRPRQNQTKEIATLETYSGKLVYPLPDSILTGSALLSKRIA